MPDNPFVHAELASTDLAKAKAFYGSLFDWDIDDTRMPGYTFVGVGEHEYGIDGAMTPSEPNEPSRWIPYVAVSDVAAATAKARSLGATILKDVTPVEGHGIFSLVEDPTGAVFGIWHSARGE